MKNANPAKTQLASKVCTQSKTGTFPDANKQAHAILQQALTVDPSKKIGLTYSANREQTVAINKAGGKIPSDLGGANQAAVVANIRSLLDKDPTYASLKDSFILLPISTMQKAGGEGKAKDSELKAELDSIQAFHKDPKTHTMVWVDKDNKPAIGGGVAATAGTFNSAQKSLAQTALSNILASTANKKAANNQQATSVATEDSQAELANQSQKKPAKPKASDKKTDKKTNVKKPKSNQKTQDQNSTTAEGDEDDLAKLLDDLLSMVTNFPSLNLGKKTMSKMKMVGGKISEGMAIDRFKKNTNKAIAELTKKGPKCTPKESNALSALQKIKQKMDAKQPLTEDDIHLARESMKHASSTQAYAKDSKLGLGEKEMQCIIRSTTKTAARAAKAAAKEKTPDDNAKNADAPDPKKDAPGWAGKPAPKVQVVKKDPDANSDPDHGNAAQTP